MHFSLFGWGEKTRETKNREKNFPSRPIFFYPPNLWGKWEEKSAKSCTLHKYPQFKLHFFSFFSLPWAATSPPLFLGNNVTSNVATFFCFFFFFFFFFKAVTLPIVTFFFLALTLPLFFYFFIFWFFRAWVW